MSRTEPNEPESNVHLPNVPIPDDASAPGKKDQFPVAVVQSRGAHWKRIFGQTRMWIATAICAIVAVVLLVMAFGSAGYTITINFGDGYGIKPGDTLRYRGIDVGEVTGVNVDPDLHGVTVEVDLHENASQIARTGSRFWIERPQVGLARISGLETVVGAKFIGVIPGPEDTAANYHFDGVESPPVIRDGSATQITISFRDGFGIHTGDVVKHLGIVIGEVTAVELLDSLDKVKVHVRLADSAATIARAGSRFWIERPQLTITEVRGLDTLLGGQYIAVAPGPSDGQVVWAFEGLNTAPPAERKPGGLEIVLESIQKGALSVGVPIHYRGVPVGHVISSGLAADASSVQARIYIEPEFKSLVRTNSQFWSNSGIDADFSVRGGLKLRTDSLQSLAIGSIGFATPDARGRKAKTGDRFACADRVEEEWLEWNPQIAVGGQLLPEGTNKPELLRSSMIWQQKRLGFSRQNQQQGWLLFLDDGRLVGLSRFLTPPITAIDSKATFEMSGAEFDFDSSRLKTSGDIAAYRIARELGDSLPKWSRQQIRTPEEFEESLIVGDPQTPMVPLTLDQLEQVEDNQWLIKPSISYNSSMDGACLISLTKGDVLGFLDLSKGQARVILVGEL